ncbi:hypothetical protein BESB_049540 [Besnoitia besnoiti]|uniref:Mediator complex subunit MED9 n=1 Tax=Besnoitia besnoiti TaxID=94643 RepID=A0A2A9MMJ6_BESBE|nr:hypothetical protein BESB_049540 [Besnoitia besnoiti]PFH36762.1 hypothetical protein BESB_049540 [Besnoitia besnoiti]
MDITELGDLSLNVEASKVSSAFARVLESLRSLTEKQELLSKEVFSLAERVAAGEETRKVHSTTLEANTRSTDQLRDHFKEIDGLKLKEQTKKIQVHEEQFQKTLALLEQCDLKLKEQDAKIAQVAIEARQSSTAAGKAVENFSAVNSSMVKCQERVAELLEESVTCANRCNKVEEDQKTLQDAVASKYDKLWHEVVTALEQMNSAELGHFQEAISRRSQQSEQRVQQLISYAIGLATRAARDRRETDVKKAVISRWKERAWIGARQRMACRSLSRLLRLHLRRHFTGFQRSLAWENQVERLKTEFRSSLPDVEAVVQGAVNSRIEKLETRVGTEATMVKQIKVEVERLSVKTGELQTATDTLGERSVDICRTIEKVHHEIKEALDREAEREDRLHNAEELVSDIAAKMSQVAKQDEMQGIMKDVLLIWTAVKQLDTAKADKRELDAFANEATTRDQHSNVCGKLGDVEATVHDVNTRSKTLNYMLGIMMRFLEDVVRKIASIDTSTTQTTCHTNRVIRTGGGWIPPRISCPGASRPVSPSRRPRVSPCGWPAVNSVSQAVGQALDGEPGEMKNSISANGDSEAAQRGAAGLGDLPTPKTSFENMNAILLPDSRNSDQPTELDQARPWKEEEVGAERARTMPSPNRRLRSCLEDDYAKNPAVRAFTDWVEQVRVVFDAQARQAAAAGMSAEPLKYGIYPLF